MKGPAEVEKPGNIASARRDAEQVQTGDEVGLVGAHQLTHLATDAVAHHRRAHRTAEGKGNRRCRIGRIGEHDAPDGPATNTCSLLAEALELVGAAQVTDQADSRLRPFRRRAFRTARPPRVAIRARKPCFIDRRFLLG